MVKQGVHKFTMVAASSLVVFALASTPVQAHHSHSVIGPAVAFIALGALLNHGHHGHYSHSYSYSYGHGHSHRHHGHHNKSHRRHSYSHGGYHDKRRKH